MTILTIDDLRCHYSTDGSVVKAVDGISFGLEEGEIVGLIGESGSGKTTIALSIMGLLPESARHSGEISYRGTDLSALPEDEMNTFRWTDIAIVFQNSLEVLAPSRIGVQVCEPDPAKGMGSGEAGRVVQSSLRWWGLTRLDGCLPAPGSQGDEATCPARHGLSCDEGVDLLVTSALDAFTRKEIRDLLLDLRGLEEYA